MATVRFVRCSLAVLPLLLASAVPLAVQAGPRESSAWSRAQWVSDDFEVADRAFSSGSRLFYAGPQWFRNSLPASRAQIARTRSWFLIDRSGDPVQPEPVGVGTPADGFELDLFNDVSPFVRRTETKTPTVILQNPTPSPTPSPTPTATANTAYTWTGSTGGQWNVNTNWVPSTAFPNGQGDTAQNTQGVNTTVNQATPGGVTVGVIRHQPTADASWTIATTTPITLDADVVGIIEVSNNVVPAVGSNNALIITGAGGLVLGINAVAVVNVSLSTAPNGSIQLDTPISGNGQIQFINNGSNNASAGQIALLQPNTFTGSASIVSGAVTFNNNASFGDPTNIVFMGGPGTPAATLVSSAEVLAMANPIYIQSGSAGTLVLGGKNATQTNYTGTLTLDGNVTLTSATTVDSNAARTTAFTNTISDVGAVTVTGTSTSVGFVELLGANTYHGGTTVNSGTLLVNNTTTPSGTGSGAVTVNNGGTLGGGGFIDSGANNITINSGGRITGGGNGAVASTGAVGTLTLTAPTLSLSGTYLVDINGATADRLTLFGNLDLSSGTDAISFTTLATPTAPAYTLISYTGNLVGTFDSTSGLPDGYFLQYNPGSIDLVAVPEASTWIGAALALLAIGFTQRRKLSRLIRKPV